MDYNDMYVTEYISQLEIAKCIKELKNDNKKELVEKVQKIINKKKKIIN